MPSVGRERLGLARAVGVKEAVGVGLVVVVVAALELEQDHVTGALFLKLVTALESAKASSANVNPQGATLHSQRRTASAVVGVGDERVIYCNWAAGG